MLINDSWVDPADYGSWLKREIESYLEYYMGLHQLLEDQPDEVILAYIYHILLHEYIHSLGFLNERQCRQIVLEITKNVFKETPNHPAVVLARKGIGAYFPDLHLIYAPANVDPWGRWQIEAVKDFDRESFRYFG